MAIRAWISVTAVALALLVACAEQRPAEEPTQQEREAAREMRERVAATVVVEALRQYRAGGSREDLARALSGVADKNTTGGAAATFMLASLRARPAYDAPATTELDVLVHARIEALVEERCEEQTYPSTYRSVEALIGLGITALDALEKSQKDRRLTRCVGGLSADPGLTAICQIDPSACPKGPGPPIPDVATVGTLASRAVGELTSGRKAIDRSDIECNPRGGDDREPDARMASAIASRDWPRALTLTRRAAGKVRLRLVDAFATGVPAQDARAFLVEEATEGPVLAARMRAVTWLRDRDDRAWPSLAAATVDLALSSEDPQHPRCDRDLVARELPKLLDKFPKATAAALAKSFGSYAPLVKAEVVRAILTTSAPLTAEGAALVAEALGDTRSTNREWPTSRGPCANATPSDLAAVHMSTRVNVSYDCSFSTEEKARAVEAILAKRGKVAGW